ncbi:MAG: hypothetical protein HOP20_10670 [Sulfuriferula sp.]|nr:hypothetical protein [Sulfuriferula sp.]
MDNQPPNLDKIAELQARFATADGRSKLGVWLRGLGLVAVLVVVMHLGLVSFWFQPSCEGWAQTLNKPVASVDYSTSVSRNHHASGVRNCTTGCCKVEFVDGSSKSTAFSNVSFWKSWMAIFLNLEVSVAVAAGLVYQFYLRRHGVDFRRLFTK